MKHPLFLLCILFFIAPALSAAEQAGAGPELIVRDYKDNKIIFKIHLSQDQNFTIRYIHSVDHSPVFEVFTVKKDKGIVLNETYFRMFGAGMGHWEGHGTVIQEGNWIKIKEIDYPLGKFLLRIGSIGVDHTIIIDEKEWNLSEIAAGRLAEIAYSKN
jgi:hypothetical protein